MQTFIFYSDYQWLTQRINLNYLPRMICSLSGEVVSLVPKMKASLYSVRNRNDKSSASVILTPS